MGGPEIEIAAIATCALGNDAPKHAVKFGDPEYGAIGYGALGFDALDFSALDNGTLEYNGLVDDVKANGSYTVPRL